MSADILSLSKVRKAKDRATKTLLAEQNRIVFGRTKAEKQINKSRNDQLTSALNGAKLDAVKEPPGKQ